MSEDEPAKHCELAEQVNLLAALKSTVIEHLDVDTHRVIAIYQSAVLMIIVTEGQITSATAIDVEIWSPPPYDPDYEPSEILSMFIDCLPAVTAITETEST